MSRAYPFRFAPCFHEYRLEAPENTQPLVGDTGGKRVFVCSMADLFGKWVPKEWLQSVSDACLASSAWEYLFLTKNPARYASAPLVPGAWYGATVTRQADVARVEKAMQAFDAVVRWVSVEPMLECVKFSDLSWCDLVVIGAQTSTVQPEGVGFVEAIAPEFDWVVDLVSQCRAAGVPYYLKPNLGSIAPGMVFPRMAPRRRRCSEK
jgi:protein gp37